MDDAIAKIEPYSDDWQREANAIARDFAPPIKPCADCNHPVVKGYCCNTCGSSNP